jgi:hypothetical protein
VRAFPQEIGVRWALVGVVALLALSLLILSLAVVWLGILLSDKKLPSRSQGRKTQSRFPPSRSQKTSPLSLDRDQRLAPPRCPRRADAQEVFRG